MEWWQSAVFYQIYPRSFADSDADGTGDLSGIASRLDYLSETLKVNAIWISPFYKSPMVDNGYDVQDYYAIDPLFGTSSDLEYLIKEAKARNLRVIMDWIPNHTSDTHQWFTESRSSRSNPRRDWYVWRDSSEDGGPPNNWRSFFPRIGRAWTFDAATEQWYLHSFLPCQPDLNWHNPEVEAAMHETARFWLDRGIDGFRIDALPLIGKDALLRSNEDDTQPWGEYNIDWHTIHDSLRRLRVLFDSYGERILIGEVNLLDTRRLGMYVTGGDELHLAHNFLLLSQPWEAAGMGTFIDRIEQAIPFPALPSWYLGNHDNSRVVTRLGGGRTGATRARVAALMLLTLRGVPFIYQGEELGLPDSPVQESYLHDIDGREPQRSPMPWDTPSRTPGGGFTTGHPWLPLHYLAKTLNVALELSDDDSMLTLYRQLIGIRSGRRALQVGEYLSLPAPAGVICYARQAAGDRLVIMLNFTDDVITVPVTLTAAPPVARVLLSTDSTRTPGIINLGSIELRPNEGIIVDAPHAGEEAIPAR
jgi:alpha-glucosidase